MATEVLKCWGCGVSEVSRNRLLSTCTKERICYECEGILKRGRTIKLGAALKKFFKLVKKGKI